MAAHMVERRPVERAKPLRGFEASLTPDAEFDEEDAARLASLNKQYGS